MFSRNVVVKRNFSNLFAEICTISEKISSKQNDKQLKYQREWNNLKRNRDINLINKKNQAIPNQFEAKRINIAYDLFASLSHVEIMHFVKELNTR